MVNKEALIKFRKRNPCLSLRVVGDKFGITGERVRQILKRGNAPTKSIRRPKYTCTNCGIKIKKNKSGFCYKCYKEEHSPVMVACQYCGKLITKQRNLVLKQQYGFCSRKCLGKFAAEHYGWKIHPENRQIGRAPLKYKQEYLNAIHNLMATGMTIHAVMVKLNIPVGNHAYLKKRLGLPIKKRYE